MPKVAANFTLLFTDGAFLNRFVLACNVPLTGSLNRLMRSTIVCLTQLRLHLEKLVSPLREQYAMQFCGMPGPGSSSKRNQKFRSLTARN